MKTLTETYEAIKEQTNRIEYLNMTLNACGHWHFQKSDIDEQVKLCQRQLSEAKSELIRLYKNLIIDCESELELLQPDYTKNIEYIALKAEYNSIKARKVMYINRHVYEKDLTEAHDKLTAYEAKHNINPENKEV